MKLVLMTKALVGQHLTVCSTWASGLYLLTGQHSRAGSGGMSEGEQALSPVDGAIGCPSQSYTR